MLKNLLLLAGFSTFVVFVIIGLNVFHDHEVSSLPASTQIHVNSITPNFDTKTLDQLKKRTPISVSLLEKSAVVSEDSKQTTILPTPTKSPILPPPSLITASTSAVPTTTITPALQQ